jgi:hypothetical protein
MTPTKTKQKIAQHESHQNKTKDCPTRTPPKQKIAQHEPHQNKTKEFFCFVLVGFVLGNLLFCFGGVRVGQPFVLFWWGSCWAIICFLYSVL